MPTNGSIIKFNGQFKIAARALLKSDLPFNHSRILYGDIDINKLYVVNHISLNINYKYPTDPRLFIYNNKIHCAFNAEIPCKSSHQGIYDFNSTQILKSFKEHDKSWQFFEHHRRLLAIHSCHNIINISDYSFYYNKPPEWKYGEIRGGTPPLLIGDRFITFFHSHIEKQNNRYYSVGWYTFSINEPFKILESCKNPILLPNKDEFSNYSNSYVVFPCGAYIINDEFFISYGAGDKVVKLCKWKFGDNKTTLLGSITW